MRFTTAPWDREQQLADGELWENEVDDWLMPLWWDAVVGATYDGSNDRITADGLTFAWRYFFPGVTIAIYHPSSGEWETAEVSIREFDGENLFLQLTDPLETPLTSRSVIYPTHPVALSPDITRVTQTAARGQMEVEAEFIDFEPPPTPPIDLPEYRDLKILTDRPTRDETIEAVYSHSVSTVDYDVGRITYYDDTTSPTMGSSQTHRFFSTQEIAQHQQFFDELQGRRGELWVPTDHADLTVTFPEPDLINVTAIHWGDRYEGTLARSFILLRTRDGVYPYEVTGGVDTTGGTTLFLDDFDPDPPPTEIGEIIQAQWLERSRLDTDQIEWRYYTPGRADVTIPRRTLRND